MKKRIVLCADDYGQANAISEGIITLLKNKRLSAASCLVTGAAWDTYAHELLPYAAQADIGLHFNLTEGQPLSPGFRHAYGSEFPGLKSLMLRGFLHRYDQKLVVEECHAQVDAFVANMGFLPQFIDGHQHVQQFPVVREALLEVYTHRFNHSGSYIRWVDPVGLVAGWRGQLKSFVIRRMGANALKMQLNALKIPHNSSFSGIYAFSNAIHYPQYFPQFLKAVHDNGLIMCHPGLASVDAQDAIANARHLEYQYLASEQFSADCERLNVQITRFWGAK